MTVSQWAIAWEPARWGQSASWERGKGSRLWSLPEC